MLNADIPNHDVYHIIRELRTHDKTRCVPIILMTGSKDEFEKAKAFDYGANSYALKPRSYEEFVDFMEGLIHYWFDIIKLPPVQKC